MAKKTTAKVPAPSAADNLAEILRSRIVAGEFTVGQSLPSERELMSAYEVSRATVREGLRMLSAQGLIQVRRGRNGGSYISHPTIGNAVQSLNMYIRGQDIRFIDLVFAREAIEPAAAVQAALSRSEEQLEALRLACVECEQTLGDIEKFVEANVKWHLAVAAASCNPLFNTFLASISDALHTATDLEEFDLRTRKAVVGVHWQIYDAIRLQDPVAARRRMDRHLGAYSERLSSLDLALRHKDLVGAPRPLP